MQNHHGRVRATGEKFKLSDFIKLINTAKPRYSLLIVGVALGVISTLISLYVPKMMASLVNNFSKSIDYELLTKVILLFILSAIISVVAGIVTSIFGQNVVKNLREQLWVKLVNLRIRYFDETKTGEMSSRLVNDTDQVKNLLANTFPRTLTAILTIIGAVYFMFKADWQLTTAMVVVVPLAFLLIMPIMMVAAKIGRSRQDTLAEFSGTASETLSEIRLVKSSNAEQQVIKKAYQEIEELFKIGKKEATYDSFIGPFMTLIMMGLIFGLLALGINRVANGEMKIGILMSFLMYLFNIMGAVPTVATLFSETAKTAGSTSRIRDLLKEKGENHQKGKSIDVEGKTLRMSNVSFAYDKKEPILKNISFEAKPNTIVAFAGPSGGGKSTIFSLIERFYRPVSGKLKIGNTDAATVNLTNWREQIGFVSQDSAIMAGTIRENLLYGLTGEYTDEQLWHVLELAFAKKFVEKMPKQLDTQVGERGVKVSGGQRQRLAIARAFLRDPKILMLDEATASLDSESEAMVQQALDSLMKGRTTLVIAHRLSTIVDADNIYFVENGEITGSGKHAALVKSHPLYRQYVSEQFKQ